MSNFSNHSLFLLFVNRFCYSVGKTISKKYNLSINERNALIVLSNLNINSISELSEYLVISKTNTSKVLNSLEKKNLIIRILDKSDKRQIQLLLTEEGKDMAVKVMKEISILFENRISAFPKQLSQKIKMLVDEYSEQKKLINI